MENMRVTFMKWKRRIYQHTSTPDLKHFQNNYLMTSRRH